jgi:hypothetical protein
MRKKILKIKNNCGFVILFAVTVSSILLAIALGVANIALKEVKFSTVARDTNDAFFAADTGTESALFADRADNICTPAPTCSHTFSAFQLGSLGKSCVNVSVNKVLAPPATTIISKGYSIGENVAGSCEPSSKSVERELITTY